jgi:predicted nucleic acid-binding protein
MRAIVADASPLIMLARSELLDVARHVAGDLVVPNIVWEECSRDASRPGAGVLIAARKAKRIDIRDAQWSGPALPALDAGELAAIALALTLRCPVLMDERLGRRVATDQGLIVIGSAGLLLAAKGKGLIPAVRPILEAWASWGYFLSAELKAAVIARAGE